MDLCTYAIVTLILFLMGVGVTVMLQARFRTAMLAFLFSVLAGALLVTYDTSQEGLSVANERVVAMFRSILESGATEAYKSHAQDRYAQIGEALARVKIQPFFANDSTPGTSPG